MKKRKEKIMKISSSMVEDYLHEYGWTFRRIDQGSWLTGWKGNDRSFPLTLTLSESWLLMEVRPFLILKDEQLICGDLLKYLLELNHLSHMIKLSIDPENQVILSVQLFAHALCFDEFADALGVLGYYAELLHDDIYTRARHSLKVISHRPRFLT